MLICPTNKMESEFSSWSPKRWIHLCNSFLLIIFTLSCGIVIYEIHSLDQRFISIIDSSIIAIDLMNVDLIESQTQPYWRDVNDDLSVYSAFYDPSITGDNFVIIIGTNENPKMIQPDDIRCLVQYVDGEVSLVNAEFHKTKECSTVFAYCLIERNFIPTKVALVSVGNTIPKQWMQVEVVPKLESPESTSKQAICVSPLTEDVSVRTLESFIHISQINDISQFYFYNYNSSQKVVDALLQLISNGHPLRVMAWNKNINDSAKCTKESREYIQDCMYRAMGMFSQVIMADINDIFSSSFHEEVIKK